MKVNFKELFKPANLVKALIAGIAIWIIFNLYSGTYPQQIIKFRKEKDHYYRTSINSPIPEKEKFEGLTYFPLDEQYKVVAKVKILPEQEEITMASTDGRKLTYLKYAIASFVLKGRHFSLLMLKNASENREENLLFVPFTDKTNGEETYSAGRYMDVTVVPGKETVLDFNLAYHPFCLYNYKYSCPIPPPQNYLDMEVRAGEKLNPEHSQ